MKDNVIIKNIPGSIELLEAQIKNKDTSIDTSEIMFIMPKITAAMDACQRSIFTGFYWRKMSMVDLQYHHGIKLSEVDDILTTATDNFIEMLKEQVHCVNGKNVCLSGDFDYGKKSDVEAYIVERGGVIDSSVKKSTNILIVAPITKAIPKSLPFSLKYFSTFALSKYS